MLAPLSGLAETTLAQIIPATGPEQQAWLRWLDQLANHRWPRPAARDRYVAWASVNLRTVEQRQASDLLADWALFDARFFDPTMSLQQALAASCSWHAAQAILRRVPSLLAANDRARVIDYAPLPDEVVIDGLVFSALRSIAELETESQRMHQCMRNYWRFVATGRSRIFSIRRVVAEGAIHLATLELQPRAGTFALAQLKGPCNAKPSDAVADAARRFLGHADACLIEAAKTKRAAS